MASVIVRKGILHFQFTGPVVVDLSCYATALELTPSVEEVDVGTFCAPSLTDQGRVTYSAVASFLWEPALYTALQPYVGAQMVVGFAPEVVTQYLKFTSRFSSQPWGRFEVGQRVEVDLPLAVLDTPVWVVGTLPLAFDDGTPNPAALAAPEPVEPAAAPEA